MNLSDFVFDLFNYNRGVYVEAGANNGISQSNTYRLERERNWSGMLIEPSLISLNKCIESRGKGNIFVNCCLVADNYGKKYIHGDFDGHLMASVDGKRLKRGRDIKALAQTLMSVTTKYKFFSVNLLSLDVEDYEVQVLEGADFNVFKPEYIIIEIHINHLGTVKGQLLKNYKFIGNITNYNIKDNPFWDQAHDDYLFRRKLDE